MTSIGNTSGIDYCVGSALEIAGSRVSMVTSPFVWSCKWATLVSVIQVVAASIIGRNDPMIENKLENYEITSVFFGTGWAISRTMDETAKEANALGSCLKSCNCPAVKGCFFEKIVRGIQIQP